MPDGAPQDPELWARAVFDVRSLPRWVGALFWLRQRLVRLVGIQQAHHDVFDVATVVGEEALISSDAHLDFRCAVGVAPQARLLRVTTAVRLHGWRGRLCFAPVSMLHGPVTRVMCRGAVRRLAAFP